MRLGLDLLLQTILPYVCIHLTWLDLTWLDLIDSDCKGDLFWWQSIWKQWQSCCKSFVSSKGNMPKQLKQEGPSWHPNFNLNIILCYRQLFQEFLNSRCLHEQHPVSGSSWFPGIDRHPKIKKKATSISLRHGWKLLCCDSWRCHITGSSNCVFLQVTIINTWRMHSLSTVPMFRQWDQLLPLVEHLWHSRDGLVSGLLLETLFRPAWTFSLDHSAAC